MPFVVKALRDLDRTTGPTPKGTVFELPDSDADGVKILVDAGYVEIHKPDAGPKKPAAGA
jgi:hypothetical protein